MKYFIEISILIYFLTSVFSSEKIRRITNNIQEDYETKDNRMNQDHFSYPQDQLNISFVKIIIIFILKH